MVLVRLAKVTSVLLRMAEGAIVLTELLLSELTEVAKAVSIKVTILGVVFGILADLQRRQKKLQTCNTN
jgi:hypothetical protein